MKIEFSKDIKTFLAGCVTMLVLFVALGADKAPMPGMPKYSVQIQGRVVNIVNNQTNTLYVYTQQPDAAVLRKIVDLEGTGKLEIKAREPEGQTSI